MPRTHTAISIAIVVCSACAGAPPPPPAMMDAPFHCVAPETADTAPTMEAMARVQRQHALASLQEHAPEGVLTVEARSGRGARTPEEIAAAHVHLVARGGRLGDLGAQLGGSLDVPVVVDPEVARLPVWIVFPDADLATLGRALEDRYRVSLTLVDGVLVIQPTTFEHPELTEHVFHTPEGVSPASLAVAFCERATAHGSAVVIGPDVFAVDVPERIAHFDEVIRTWQTSEAAQHAP